MRAAFFDVGDTLVDRWVSPDRIRTLAREALVRAFGERAWYDDWLSADIEPQDGADPLRHDTLAWYAAWFEREGVALRDLSVEAIRRAMTLPMKDVSTPVPGAFDAVRWCKARGLAVVILTNTLSRGDAEVLEDWRGYGVGDAIDGVASSHSVGWRKPHRAMFERALVIADCVPAEAFMVGDDLYADVWGAQQLGLRTVWRRTADGGRALPDGLLVRPDATVDDLTELPAAVGPWLVAAGSRR